MRDPVRFFETNVSGVVRIEADPLADERGVFARIFCPAEFAAAGIMFEPRQVNLSRNIAQHTLRGMHFQAPPNAEGKLVRVTRGSIYDVALDIRPDSPTFGNWTAAVLDAKSLTALFIPEGCAHGFLTLEADTDVLYHMGHDYVPGAARGIRYDDPAFAIRWPAPPAVISERDRTWPLFAGTVKTSS